MIIETLFFSPEKSYSYILLSLKFKENPCSISISCLPFCCVSLLKLHFGVLVLAFLLHFFAIFEGLKSQK